jgi:ABC-type transporter Mla maintaining outer membrane lipid asymmetry permease subunit MlaE
VALVGCLQGLDSMSGAQGGGPSTTRAVGLGCEAMLVRGGFWALVLL